MKYIDEGDINKSDLTPLDRLHLQSAEDASDTYRLNLYESMALHAFHEFNEEGEFTRKANFHVTKYLAGIEKPEKFADPNALLQKKIQQQLAKAFESGVIQVPSTATTADFMNAALQQQNSIVQTVVDSQSQDSNHD